jgi:tetraacyldisaccharide 4'-kinase
MQGSDQQQWPAMAKFLQVLSNGYGLVARSRMRLYDQNILVSRRLPCPVIAVGNLTVGGTGKTPMTIYIARFLRQLGCRVAVLSRGYGGRAEQKGGWVSDGRRIMMDPDSAGDEPYMMASKMPGIAVLVGKDRYRSGMLAISRFRAGVLVLDDAFQHLRVQRDLNLLLLDAHQPFGNGYLLPRGPLRMPAHSVGRADAIILTRCEPERYEPFSGAQSFGHRPVFRTQHVPTLYKAVFSGTAAADKHQPALQTVAPAVVRGASVFAFAGIADNERFKSTLEDLNLLITGFLGFGDHHRYTRQDLHRILTDRSATGAHWLATTEKDFFRVCNRLDANVPLIVVGIEIGFLPDSSSFNALLARFARSGSHVSRIQDPRLGKK